MAVNQLRSISGQRGADFRVPQSSLASRATAGAFGFLTFTQCTERPDRYGESRKNRVALGTIVPPAFRQSAGVFSAPNTRHPRIRPNRRRPNSRARKTPPAALRKRALASR
jgi:hypothetical protein